MAVGAWSHGLGGKSYVYGKEGSSGLPGGTGPTEMFRVRVSPNPSTAFDFFLHPGQAHASVRIHDPEGTLIRVLPVGEGAVSSRVRWDGRDERGRRSPAGVYFYSIRRGAETLAKGRLMIIR
jgi:hypothetical protein